MLGLAALVVLGLVAAGAFLARSGEDEDGSTGASATESPAPAATQPAPSGTAPGADPDPVAPPVTTAPSSSPPSSGVSFDIGDPFSETCVIAWPSAPIRDSTTIQMAMSCPDVPSEFFLVQVVYSDPDLEVTPSTGSMQVTGEVYDIVQSDMGFQTLVVLADRVDF